MTTNVQLSADAAEAEWVEVKKIWDKGAHNAFTDLVWFKERWFCVFREGRAHVSPDGAFRVLTSKDGATWESAALIKSEKGDLRDVKFAVTARGQLMLVGAAALHKPTAGRHQSMTWFSDDGANWGEPSEVGDVGFWLWRVTWQGDSAYGFGYGTGTNRNNHFLRLYRSSDGKRFETLIENAYSADSPNETKILFRQDGTALCLLRREEGSKTAQLGIAAPPYKDWRWRDLGKQVGGPNMIQLPDGRIVAAARLYDGKVRTSLLWLDPKAATLKEFLTLPSGGDTSYAGLVWKDGLLWVSYYSSHEGKTSIYLAKVKISPKP